MSWPASEITGEMRLPGNGFHSGAWVDLRDGAEPVEVLSAMDVPSPLVIYRCYWAGRLTTMQTFVCCGPAAPLPERQWSPPRLIDHKGQCPSCGSYRIDGLPPILHEPDCEWSR